MLPAPPERVFAAWTDAVWLARWMSPVGHARVEADPRPGGRLHVVMLGEGREIEHVGQFLEVEPPHRLSFTWSSAYTGDRPSRVTVELTPATGGTDLRLRHERLPAGAAASHRGGWGSMLERLAQVLAAREEVADGMPCGGADADGCHVRGRARPGRRGGARPRPGRSRRPVPPGWPARLGSGQPLDRRRRSATQGDPRTNDGARLISPSSEGHLSSTTWPSNPDRPRPAVAGSIWR